MGASDGKFDRTHDAILAAGQRVFRRQGYQGTSLRDVMKEAGLTVGGFYAHFDSKEDLFRACFEKAGEAGLARLTAGAGKGEFLKPVQRYLGEAHVRAKADGCPLAALVSELDGFRSDGPPPMVDAYLERFAREMTRLGAAPDRVFALYAMMLGGLALARAVADPGLRRSILAQSRQTAADFASGRSKSGRRRGRTSAKGAST